MVSLRFFVACRSHGPHCSRDRGVGSVLGGAEVGRGRSAGAELPGAGVGRRVRRPDRERALVMEVQHLARVQVVVDEPRDQQIAGPQRAAPMRVAGVPIDLGQPVQPLERGRALFRESPERLLRVAFAVPALDVPALRIEGRPFGPRVMNEQVDARTKVLRLFVGECGSAPRAATTRPRPDASASPRHRGDCIVRRSRRDPAAISSAPSSDRSTSQLPQDTADRLQLDDRTNRRIATPSEACAPRAVPGPRPG